MPIKDVIVTINLANPAPRVGLGRPVIFTQKTGESTYKEYTGLETLAVDYPVGTPAHDKAKVIFNQENRPDIVAVATYDLAIEDSMAEHFNRAWHFALVAGDVPAEQQAAATYMNDRDFKILAVQVSDDIEREALKGMKRVAVFNHDVEDEHLDAAAVGGLASLPVGSISWKFHTLRGVTGQHLTATQLADIEIDNAIAYVVKSGVAQLSEGTLADGEYIDTIHGQDWVKADMENEIQHTLVQAARFNSKLPYDSRGIGAIRAAATTTLERAYNNGIIALTDDGAKDYTITTKTRGETDPQERNERIYSGLSFSFGQAGAIHEARVKGQIKK